MTQPVMMTYPYLAQWGARKAAAELSTGLKIALQSPASIRDAGLRAALQRAIREGTVEPHQIHELSAAAMSSSSDWGKLESARQGVNKALFAWGRLFSLSEQFNRRSTFAAAYQIGRNLSADQLAKAEVKDAYDFAVKAVNETQGIYNRGNRPDWARGAAGATLFTFKQFSVSYLELLKRLPRRERLLALAILTMSAGVNGLPFADDLDDLIDTILQNLGIATSSKLARHAMLSKVLGEGAAEFLENGASTFLPIDVQGRLGMPDLIPGTGIGLKSNTDKASQALQALGPAGSLAQSAGTAVTGALSGDVGAALNAFAPTAVQNAMKAMQMGEMGMYRDQAGRRVVDTTASDALWKGIGFQPEDVAGEQKKVSLVEERINLAKQIEGEIAGTWAEGIFEGDREKVEQARDQLISWNRENPEDRIRIQPAAVARRVKEMKMSRVQRIEKLAPRSMRGEVRQELT